MKAIALQKISPLIDKGSVLIKAGKYGILEGYEHRLTIECTVESWLGDRVYQCPNFYPWETIQNLKEYYKIEK